MNKFKFIFSFAVTNLIMVTHAMVSFAQTQAEVTETVETALAPNNPPKNLEEMATQQIDTIKNLINMISEFLVAYSFQVLGGIIVIVLGWLFARFVCNWLLKFFNKKQFDITVSKFIVGMVRLTIITFVFIVALGKFGIEMAPLIAAVSVVGFGTSFALQGPLSNYAAGIALIFSKPFMVGQIIEVAGVMGEVIDIKLPKTELKTVDGNTVSIPNKHIVGEIIHNYSDNKKIDINVGVSYNADVDKAIKIVSDIISGDDRVTKNAKVGITEFADSSINIYARLWVKQDQYWSVMFDVNKKIFDEFNNNGVVIPFPQRDVHIIDKS